MDIEKTGAIGPEGSWKMAFKDGKVILSAKHVHASGEASIELMEDAAYFLDLLAKSIPGQIDDAIIAALKAAL